MSNASRVTYFLVVVIVCALHNLPGLEAATADDVSKLISTLQQNYSRQVRPPYNQSETLTVNIGFLLNSIREFDEASEEFSCIGIVVISWSDDRLRWDPNVHGGVNELTVDNDVFWAPSIYLQNSMDNFERIAHATYWKIKYMKWGLAYFYPGDVFTSYCRVKVEKYPWDTQTCTLTFGLITYLEDEVRLLPNIDIGSLRSFTGDGTWDLVSSRYSNSYNLVHVELTLCRKPRFVILNVVIPVMFMFLLDILVFLIPAESGERISFCLTVLLAITVFLTLVADTMPKSASSIAWFSYYLVAILGVCILNTLGAILNLRLYFKNDSEPVPRFFVSLVNLAQSKRLCTTNCWRKVSPPPELDDEATNKTVVSIINLEKSDIKGNIDDIDGLPNKEHEDCQENIETSQPVTWKTVSAFLDKLFLLSALSTSLAFTGIYLFAVLN